MYAVLDAYKLWFIMGFGIISVGAIYEFLTEK